MGREDLKQFLVSQDKKSIERYIWHNMPIYIPNLLFVVISVLAFVFFLFWLCFSGCFTKKKIYKKNGFIVSIREEGCCMGKFCRKFVCFTNVLIPCLLMLAVFAWGVFSWKIIGTVEPVYCGVSTAFNELINGANYNNTVTNLPVQFAGMNGYIWYVNEALIEYSSTLNMKDPGTINSLDLEKKGGNFLKTLTNFYGSFKNRTIVSPTNKSKRIQPDSLTNLTVNVTPEIGQETHE